ncbi:protein REPRESSOR OF VERNALIZATION 1-like [Wolffia australiana]
MEKRRFEELSFYEEEEEAEHRLAAIDEQNDSKKARAEDPEKADDRTEEVEGEGVTQSTNDAEFSMKTISPGGNQDSQENAKLSGEFLSPEMAGSILSRPTYEYNSAASKQVSSPRDDSEVLVALEKFGELPGDSHRVRWLKKLADGFRSAECLEEKLTEENRKEGKKRMSWLDTALPATVALEKVVHEAIGTDFRKYNQKMRQLDFNLKHNPLLTKRFLTGELTPTVIMNMSPDELKEGAAFHEKRTKEPDHSEFIQMAEARCSRCSETKVGVVEIIHAGGHGDRYQLECASCGHSWSASIDDIASLTIDTSSAVRNVGAAPWATAKFEDVEKKLTSPHEGGTLSPDPVKKVTELYMPVLERNRSPTSPKMAD